jgi:chemotaxis protein methyltransferase CheR
MLTSAKKWMVAYMIQIDGKTMQLFRVFIYEKMGIHLSKDKDYLLIAKLERIMQNSRYPSLMDFYYRLKTENMEAYEILVRHITTNHTFFFREKEHFDILCGLMKLRKDPPKRIWSAASSTGEEVYSIIITLLEAGLKNFVILASDLNKDVLFHLKHGIYHKDRIIHVPCNILRKYFSRVDDDRYSIHPDLKKYVVIKKLNLIEPLPFEEKFDYIFLRNVMIYFDDATKKIVLDNILNNLKDDGYLFIGHSESLFGITDKMDSVFNSVYGKKR